MARLCKNRVRPSREDTSPAPSSETYDRLAHPASSRHLNHNYAEIIRQETNERSKFLASYHWPNDINVEIRPNYPEPPGSETNDPEDSPPKPEPRLLQASRPTSSRYIPPTPTMVYIESRNKNYQEPPTDRDRRFIADYPDVPRQATNFVEYTIIKNPENSLLQKPISVICYLSKPSDGLAIFRNFSNPGVIVDFKTLEMSKTIETDASNPQLQTDSLTVLDARIFGDVMLYAYYKAEIRKTVIMTLKGEKVTDMAKTSFMVWNTVAKRFFETFNVVRSVMLGAFGHVIVLTHTGLAYHNYKDTSKPSPIARISLAGPSSCLQSFVWHKDEFYDYFTTLTDRGDMCRVRLDIMRGEFEVVEEARMPENEIDGVVFSAVMWMTSHFTVVAGFDVNNQTNIFIVVDDCFKRISTVRVREKGESTPIFRMISWYLEVQITKQHGYLISCSSRSVYLHFTCSDDKSRLTQIFDQSFDTFTINGLCSIFVKYGTHDEDIRLIVYGKKDREGEIVHIRLKIDNAALKTIK